MQIGKTINFLVVWVLVILLSVDAAIACKRFPRRCRVTSNGYAATTAYVPSKSADPVQKSSDTAGEIPQSPETVPEPSGADSADYDRGFAAGRSEGYGEGLGVGKKEGDDEGYERGYADGLKVGREEKEEEKKEEKEKEQKEKEEKEKEKEEKPGPEVTGKEQLEPLQTGEQAPKTGDAEGGNEAEVTDPNQLETLLPGDQAPAAGDAAGSDEAEVTDPNQLEKLLPSEQPFEANPFGDDAPATEQPAVPESDPEKETLDDLFGIPSAQHIPELRTWRDNTGKFQRDARLVNASLADRVVLQLTSGSVIQVLTARLSDADRNYVASQAASVTMVAFRAVQPITGAVAWNEAEAGMRLWSSPSGKHRRVGRFLSLADGIVQLQCDNGRINVSLAKLSDRDRQYVQQRQKKPNSIKVASNR